LKQDLYPLDELLEAALTRLARHADAARIRVDLPAELPLFPAEADLLVNVFVNLLDNALRYAPQGPIDVRACVTEEYLEVTITDEGPGLPHCGSASVFDRFVRGPDRAQRGSGLGLAICKAVALAHGGRIEAGNREGRGAWFRLLLALAADPAPSARSSRGALQAAERP
jgi:two-component system sensor histidine kinase KdpD